MSMERLVTYENAKAWGPWFEPAPDILVIPFWTPDFCADLIQAADLLDEYQAYAPDVSGNAAPGLELRLNRISPRLAENYAKHVEERLLPVVFAHWWPLSKLWVRMPFMLRYSPETQNTLAPHHDATTVSVAMNLNTAFKGGALTFPRQGWSNVKVPPGHVILFPGRVTHVHRVDPVTAGVRYGCTGWLAGVQDPQHDLVFEPK